MYRKNLGAQKAAAPAAVFLCSGGTGAHASLPVFAEAPSEPGPPVRPLLGDGVGEAERDSRRVACRTADTARLRLASL